MTSITIFPLETYFICINETTYLFYFFFVFYTAFIWNDVIILYANNCSRKRWKLFYIKDFIYKSFVLVCCFKIKTFFEINLKSNQTENPFQYFRLYICFLESPLAHLKKGTRSFVRITFFRNSFFSFELRSFEKRCFRTFFRIELLPGFKFTGKMVKIMEFTGKIGKTGKR